MKTILLKVEDNSYQIILNFIELLLVIKKLAVRLKSCQF